MQVQVKVVPRAKKARIEAEGDGLKVWLTVPAVDGKANKALIDGLAKHFGVSLSRVTLTKGLKSRNKTVNIDIPNS